jgi:hypothetical protein
MEIDKPAALAPYGVFIKLGNRGLSATGAKLKIGVLEQIFPPF